jgi:hypothetical protein|tara:strand:+ start:524 stop:784 length:261 start_codon:yes stop_codon:yes gene_type:complete
MKHQDTRHQIAQSWTPSDFFKWYMKTSHASRGTVQKLTSDYLHGMDSAQIKALTSFSNDLVEDLARHRKRKICESQLRENEELIIW